MGGAMCRAIAGLIRPTKTVVTLQNAAHEAQFSKIKCEDKMKYVVRYFNQYDEFEYRSFRSLQQARKWTKDMIQSGGGASKFDIFNKYGDPIALPNYRLP